jgi:hypothetical protein
MSWRGVVIAALLALVITLLPAAYLADLWWPGSAARSAHLHRVKHGLAVIVVPPNFVWTRLGGNHLEYVHMIEPPSMGSPPHDMTGCACEPHEMRAAFLAIGWPFWFAVFCALGYASSALWRRFAPARDASSASTSNG